MKIVLARNTAMHANIWHTLKFPPEVIARLTFWQLAHIAGHKRNDRGEIVWPEAAITGSRKMSIEEQIAAVQWLARSVGEQMLATAEVDRATAELRAKAGAT